MPARATLPRGERLRERGAFDRLFRQGHRLERASFVLLWVRAPGRRAAAFVTSRRVGGSVARNRARRRLREAYRRECAGLPRQGLRLCVVARPAALTVPFPALTAEMAEALRATAQRVAS